MSENLTWIKSSYSGSEGGSQCVEVATLANGTAVRDSKDPSGPILRFSADAWRTFLNEVRSGRLQ